jgi:hypothetical protein
MSEMTIGNVTVRSSGGPAGEDLRPKRKPVDYRYDALNWNFIKAMAQIASYAAEKYGEVEQYRHSRLEGEKSPLNHMAEHMRSYLMGDDYDALDGDRRYHLAAIAYNAMIEFYYHTNFGGNVSLLSDRKNHLQCEDSSCDVCLKADLTAMTPDEGPGNRSLYDHKLKVQGTANVDAIMQDLEQRAQKAIDSYPPAPPKVQPSAFDRMVETLGLK